jgi:O-methyltransferase
MRRLWRAFYWTLLYPLQYSLARHRAAGGDPQKLRALKVVRPFTMVGFERLLNAYDLVKRAEAAQLPGAIVECGVYNGGSAAMMAMAASSQRKIWLFDSFEGLPEPGPRDGAKALLYSGERSSGALKPIDRCVGSLEVVRRLFLEELHMDSTRVMFRKGWFQETLPVARPEIGPIAVLRLDGDWYDSTLVCLEHLYDLVVTGGFVIIDDYGYWEGCRQAVDEFLSRRDLNVALIPIDDSGRWFAVPERSGR